MGIKYQINQDYFRNWSNSMAYTLGYLFADGSLENSPYIRGKYIRFTSIDLSQIKMLLGLMESKHKIQKILPRGKNEKIRYHIRIGDKKMYLDLIELGLTTRKSLTMSFPKYKKVFMPHFIRGYFDGDGHVSIEKKGKALKRIRVIFTSGSEDFLLKLCSYLKEVLNLNVDKIYIGTRSFKLSYSTSDSVKIFKYIYKDADSIYLPRKYTVFKDFFTQYNKWIDKEVLDIIR